MWLVPLVVTGLVAGAGVTITSLYAQADQGRRAQVEIGSLRLTLDALQNSSLGADPAFGGSPTLARQTLEANKVQISSQLRTLTKIGSANRELEGLGPAIRRVYPATDALFAIGASPGGFGGSVEKTQVAAKAAFIGKAAVLAQLSGAADSYAQAASRARTKATIGSAVTLLLLLGAFLFFYQRSARARVRAHDDAVTDALTGLRNRRALNQDFPKLLAGQGDDDDEIFLAMFDLDGFKQYNDTFGHGAGDALLAGLGERLADAMSTRACSYRMGGDEFCIVAAASTPDSAHLVDVAATALSASGEGWTIGCSYGVGWAPSEAADLVEALRVADQRMYASKASRSSTGRQTAAALVQVLAEQGHGLDGHSDAVAELSVLTGRQLGLAPAEIQNIGFAAQLHDIGKAAIPDTILNKPGPLNEPEWEFIRRHTIIGERIVLAAPALEQIATMVRSSHERIDGQGYPDGLAGEAIPLGSRIIAVADAYHAMTSDRPYSPAIPSEPHAIAELQRCAGTQFDTDVVEAFLTILATRPADGPRPPTNTALATHSTAAPA
jgi:diguanylate cyclase (GGDEF)-like protein